MLLSRLQSFFELDHRLLILLAPLGSKLGSQAGSSGHGYSVLVTGPLPVLCFVSIVLYFVCVWMCGGQRRRLSVLLHRLLPCPLRKALSQNLQLAAGELTPAIHPYNPQVFCMGPGGPTPVLRLPQ